MAKTWVIFDCSNILWKYHHVNRPPVSEFLNQVYLAEERFGTTHVAFAFDSRASLRRAAYPPYKPRGAENDARTAVEKMLDVLRFEDLPKLGFRNLFWADGYEADDAIASAAASLGNNEQLVIYSNDSDLYQLLSPGIRCFDGHRYAEEGWFRGKYGISPAVWPMVKALGGDTSDEIPGCRLVGEDTAVKYLCYGASRVRPGLVPVINEFVKSEQYALYKKLTKLPYPGCPKFKMVSHPWPSDGEWRAAGVTVRPSDEAWEKPNVQNQAR